MGNIAPPLNAVIVLNILLLEDSDDDALLVERALSGMGYVYSLKRARDMAEFIAQLDPAPDLILSDYHLSDCNALDALDQLKERGLDIPLILMSGRARDEDAIEAIKRGAADFLSKDRLGRLGPAIAATLERRALRQQARDIQQALEHNREELDYAFDTAAIGMALTSLDGRWLKVNQALCRITGYTEPGLLATDCHSITHQEDIAVDIDLMKQLVAGEVNSTQREKRYVHQLGHGVWVQVTASLVRDSDGTPRSRMLQVLDITHRKEAEERFQATFNQAAVGIAHTATDGKFLIVNSRLCEILGYSRDELLQKTALELSVPSERGQYAALYQEVTDGKRTGFSGEKRWVRKDGSVIWVNRTVSRAAGAVEEEPYLIQVIEDITERKRTEERLERANRARRVMAECSHILVHATDETEMLENMCRNVVESGSYRMAWVGLATGDSMRAVYPAAHAGFGDDVPMSAPHSWGADGSYQGMMCGVVTTGEPHIARDILSDPAHAPRRARAAQYGFQSSIALALKGEGRILGAIAIYAAEADAFDVEEIGLLEELTDDIAYGINNLRTRIAREQAEKAAREHERRLKWTLEQAAVGITRVGFDGLVLDVNQKFCAMLGYAKDEVIDQTIGKFTYPGDNEQDVQDRAQLACGAAKSLATEKRFVRKDGSIIWVRRTISAAYDDAGTPQYIIGVIEDITERKEREERYRVMFENAAVGITRVDLDGFLVDVNEKFCEMLGYGMDEVLGKHIKDITHPDDYGRGAQYRAQLTHRAMKSAVGEKRFVRKDGTIMWARRTMSTALDDAGKPQYVISVVEDITERKELEHRFEMTFNHAAVGMTQSSLDGHFLQVNQKYAEMLGYTREELIGMTSDEVTHPDDRAETGPLREKLLKGELESIAGEKRLVCKDGRVIWVNRTFSVARGASGEPLYFIAVVEDVTARKELERRFEVTFNQAAVGIAHTGLDERYLMVNRKFCEMVGYSKEEFIGRTADFITHPADLEQARRNRQLLYQGKVGSQSGDKRYVRKDGKVIWVRRTASLAYDEFGKPMYAIRVIEDITERKELEQQFQATFDQAAVGIIHTSLDRRLVLANRKFCEITGYDFEELRGREMRGLSHPEDVGEDRGLEEKLLAGDISTFTSSRRYIRKDGRMIWVKRTASLVRDPEGRPKNFIRVVEDISDSKEAEDRYRATVENAPVGIMHTGFDLRILHVNAKLCDILGYTREELLSMTMKDIVHPENLGSDRPQYLESMLAGKLPAFSSERPYLRKDGSTVWVNRTVSLVRDAAGKPLYFIRIIEDISERKQAEMALRDSEARYRSVIAAMAEGVLLRDKNGRIIACNASAERILGRTLDQMKGSNNFDPRWQAFREDGSPFPNEERPANTALRTGQLQSNVVMGFRKPDGTVLRLLMNAQPLFEESDATPSGVVTTITDITQRKQVELRQAMEHAITRILTEAETLAKAIPKIIQTICETMEWHCGARWQWDKETGLLRCIECWGIDTPEIREFMAENAKWSMKLESTTGRGLVRRVYSTGQPVCIADLSQENGLLRAPLVIKAGLHGAFGFPLLLGNEVLGMMEFFHRDVREPDDMLIQIAGSIGSQIGQFIQRKEAEAALRISEETFRATFNQASVGITVTSLDLQYLQVNDKYCDIVGYSREELLGGMTLRDVNVPENVEEAVEFRRKLIAGEVMSTAREKQLLRKDGALVWVALSTSLVRDIRGAPKHLITVSQDISERKRAEAALRESEEQFRQLAGNIPQVFWITDVTQKQVIYVSPASEQLLGVPVNVLQANPRKLVQAVHRDDRPRVFKARKSAALGEYDETYRIVRSDGSIRWVHDRAFPVHDDSGKVYRIAGIAEDVTDRKLAEERLMQLAHYDVLTSLPNRVLFYDRLKQALAQSKRNQWITGVMFMDVDRFKNVNDTLGHAVGDTLLQQISERLTRSVRTGDTVGRLGGDEFAIVLSNLSSAQDTNLVAQKIMASFSEPFKLEGSEIYVTASIGITLYPDDSTEQDTLIKNADAAMYRAKEAGRNNFQFYTPEMNARALEILSMENSLRHALDRNELLLYYQPKTSVADGDIVGVEALLRWQHPERGLVSPVEFIPVLEESGLIVPVGEWVLRTVCAQIKAWERAGVATVPVAVNLSARQFTAKGLGPTIQRILEEYQVDPALIELEITESCIMANAEEATRTLEYLENVGVGLSIDDFGTGYSSLGYLKRFPLSALKIDHSFVRDLTTDADDATITRAVISMAHSLGLKVIAEGVETESQLAFLSEYGCDEIQGYYFSRPLAAQECGTWLREKRRLQRPVQVADSGASIVLLVDDDDDALALLKRSLAKDGYRILAAYNAREALELLGKHHVDVVISDQKMPGIPGVEFLQRVKSLSPKTVRMMTSAYTDFQAMTDAVNKGEIFRFLPKSLSEVELRADVREALRARADAAVNIGHLVAPGTIGK